MHAYASSIADGTPRAEVVPVTRPTDRASMRRFVVAVVVGVGVAAIPYLWVLCDLWTGSPSLLRTAWSNGYASNFYDLQARALLHGHLYVANGALAGEAFLHDGHQYTYFGSSHRSCACRCYWQRADSMED